MRSTRLRLRPLAVQNKLFHSLSYYARSYAYGVDEEEKIELARSARNSLNHRWLRTDCHNLLKPLQTYHAVAACLFVHSRRAEIQGFLEDSEHQPRTKSFWCF